MIARFVILSDDDVFIDALSIRAESPDLRALRLRYRVQELREIDRGRYGVGQARETSSRKGST